METKKLDQNNGGLEKVYDVFISYRRLDTKTARNLEQALELRGLKVYFDQEELVDGKFNEELYKAIDQSRNAIFLMTKGALDRCANEGDWVRNELERILESGINLVLVHPSDVEPEFPEGLPKSLCGMRYIEVSELHLGKLFSASVDKIVKRLKGINMAQRKAKDDLPVLGKPVDEVSLTGLKGQDAQHFKKAIGYYKVLLRRSALAELQKIEKQDDPIVRYYVLRFTYELEGTVSDNDFEEACCAARDRGCTDAMVVFAARHLTNEDILFDSTPASECLEWLNKAIAGGNAEAFLTLSSAYEDGKGVKKDRARAAALCRHASECGGMQEKMLYGLELLTGDGCEKDASGAVKILRPVIKHLVQHANELTSLEFVLLAVCGMCNPIGTKDSQRIEKYLNSAIEFKGRLIEDEAVIRCGAYCTLGRMILENDKQKERTKEAFDYFMEACRLGDKEGTAEYWLGLCYENGIGVEADLNVALEYYDAAARKGNAAAQFQVAMYLFEEGENQDVERGKMLLNLSVEGGDADAEHIYGLWLIRGIHLEQDVKEGMKWLEKAAEQDDVNAMNSLGEQYRDGLEGVPINYEEAFKWFKKGAARGGLSAMRSLGWAYLKGQGIARDCNAAKKWFTKAAMSGEADAECCLGTRYADGDFGERDIAEAIKWWEKAAGHGDTAAMYNLGCTFRDGDDVDTDLKKSEEWFVRAAEAGMGDAACVLGAGYYRGDFGEPDKKKALEWSQKAADLGDATAMNNLGIMYRDGDGVEADPFRAVAWFRRASDGGLPDAMTNLGFAYLNGAGVLKDIKEAEEWFVKATLTGDADAECALGSRYADGAFGTVDYVKAVEWWQKAAAHGSAAAMCSLGRAYQHGEDGVEKDLEKAFNWFKNGADLGDTDAMTSLASSYMDGEGTAKNLEAAEEWLKKAAEKGDEYAKLLLKLDFGNDEFDEREFRDFVERAEAGDADAMESLGMAYLNGNGTDPNAEKAKEWLLRAAENDKVSAECSLGTCFAKGNFGDKDMAEAIKWWERAAEHGDVEAMQSLGATYRDCDGVDKDLHKAEEWFVRAAEAGSGDAACTLGAAYYRGDFGEPDVKKALEWSQKAAKLGDTTAMNNLGILYRDGDGVNPDPFRAVAWFRRAAAKEHAGAMVNLGFAYLKGEGELKDEKFAEEWFVKAAETGDADAEVSLGTRYAQGAFGKVDYPKAIEWWIKAAEQGQAVAMWNLGDVYRRGEEGVEKDLPQSFEWFKKSAEAGNPYAMESLGLAYLTGAGTGTAPDEERAREWLICAAENGNASAECILGSLYARDDYWDKDMGEAIKWWEKAAAHGDVTAMNSLGRVYSDPEAKNDGIPLNLDTARGWFHQADEKGCKDAAYYLGLDVLGALDKCYETYVEWQADFQKKHLEKGPAARVLRKAGSWFQKPLDAQTDDANLAGVCLRWLARIARYQENIEEAKELYRKASEKGDEKAKTELAEIDAGAATEETPLKVPDTPKEQVAGSPLLPQQADDDMARAEAIFLRYARLFKKNDGVIDENEEEKLKKKAEELKIGLMRREELILQVEEEFEAGM